MERTVEAYGMEPRYTLAEAEVLTRTPRATLRTWFVGWRGGPRRQPQRPVVLPDGGVTSPLLLSFFNIVEARFLGAYRRTGVPMQRMRPGLDYAQERMGVERPLLTRRFESDGRRLFLEWSRSLVADELPRPMLINVSEGGQLAWPEIVAEHFREIEFEDDLPRQLWLSPNRRIFLNPRISFGRPVVASKGIRTEILFERFEEARESMDEIAEDFGLDRADVEEAIRWESTPASLQAA